MNKIFFLIGLIPAILGGFLLAKNVRVKGEIFLGIILIMASGMMMGVALVS